MIAILILTVSLVGYIACICFEYKFTDHIVEQHCRNCAHYNVCKSLNEFELGCQKYERKE